MHTEAADPPPSPDTADVALGGGETVLVVEDEATVRRIASAFLRSFGYEVRAAATAEEAMRQLRQDPQIALLFSDVMLGSGMDGVQLARAAHRLRPDLAVLLTSGHERSDTSNTPSPDGRFEVLRKPYRREQLAAALRRHLPTPAPAPRASPD